MQMREKKKDIAQSVKPCHQSKQTDENKDGSCSKGYHLSFWDLQIQQSTRKSYKLAFYIGNNLVIQYKAGLN